MKVVLRVVLTVLLVIFGLEVGIKLAPSLASRTGGERRTSVSRLPVPVSRVTQPDWGGGHLSFGDCSTADIVDSVSAARGGESSKTRTYSSPTVGVALQQKTDSDYAITLAVLSPHQSNRTVLFDVPSSNRLRKELLPGERDAEAPDTDIPVYPQSRCRMQVGRGTATFIGFYLTLDSIETVRSFYVRALSKFGWRRVATDTPGFLETFTKCNKERTVVLQLRKQDSATTRIGLVATSSPTGAEASASGGPDRSERK